MINNATVIDIYTQRNVNVSKLGCFGSLQSSNYTNEPGHFNNYLIHEFSKCPGVNHGKSHNSDEAWLQLVKVMYDC